MILVTGGAGYIGSHILHALADAGKSALALDNLIAGCAALVPKAVPLHVGDCSDTRLLAGILRENAVTSIIHCAGSISVVESVAAPTEYYRNNVTNALSVIEAALSCGVRSFVFSSTATVYGAPEAERLDEDLPLAPINPYAASKAMVERILADVAASSTMRVGILRYFNVAGADPQLRSGQVSRQATHLIKVACQAALDPPRAIKVTGSDFATPDGTGVRDYVHVSDLADAHVAALRALEEGEGFTLNVGYGRGASVTEVLDCVDRVVGRRIAREFLPRRPGDVARLVADSSRARAALGWQPKRDDLDLIVTDALAWERKLLSEPARFALAG